MNNNITLALAKAYVNEKMSGVSGVKGDTGVSVTDVAINSNNHLIITLSDKSSIDAGLIETVAGKDGANGTNGTNGKDGADGVSITAISFTKDANGEIIGGTATLSDNTEIEIGITTVETTE